MKNAISIDLEDWFCAYSLRSVINRHDWDGCSLRIVESTRRILALLRQHQTQATFFILGWIAEKCPGLILEIEKDGHEIGLHGYSHIPITKLTPAEFEQDLGLAFKAIKGTGVKQEILGFRAPSFSIIKKTMWALKILEKHNIKYDSSLLPMFLRSRVQIPYFPARPYQITDKLYELPLSYIKILGISLACSGGVFFRVLPYAYTKNCIKKYNSLGQPFIFYIHPWDLDEGQPRLKLSYFNHFRHYYNLDRTSQRLNQLLGDFQFTALKNVLGL